MLKILKNLLSAASAVVLSFALALTTFAAGSYISYAGYTFSLNDKLASIHDYNGAEKELYIPETIWDYPVVAIDDDAFFGREDFTDLYLQEGKRLKDIGRRAFYGCSNIPFAEIPPSVETIGEAAFQSCTGLKELIFDNGTLTALPRQLCYGCTALEKVEILASIVTIGDYAFGGCDSLTKVLIPDSVTEISDTAFDGSNSVVIYGTKASRAIAYAEEKEIPYVVTDPDPITYMRGDADGDGTITIIDATRVQRVLADLSDDENGLVTLRAALVDPEELSILDATAIQRYLADFEDNHAIAQMETYTPVVVF